MELAIKTMSVIFSLAFITIIITTWKLFKLKKLSKIINKENGDNKDLRVTFKTRKKKYLIILITSIIVFVGFVVGTYILTYAN